MSKKIKVLTGIGIRPDIIRLSEIVSELDKWFNHITVDTGQHYDYNLNKVMYEQLNVREPNYRLDGKADSHTKQVGKIASQFEDVLLLEEPDIVLILGDNNSSLAMALAAAKLNIPIAHIESGQRSFNWNMPEEKNRTVVDHLSDIHFCYTEDARENLIAEGIRRRTTWVVGNPIIDVLELNRHRFKNNPLKKFGLKKNNYVLVTCHRAENVTCFTTLFNIISQLRDIHDKYNIPVVLIEMPKLAENVEQMGMEYPEGIMPIPPQPYLEFLELEAQAALIITDSGTVPEVCFGLSKPCIQIREKTERMELLENGATILVANDQDILTPTSCLLEGSFDRTPVYKTGVAEKIARILLGNAANAWGRR